MSILKANRIENLTTTDGGININNSGQVGVGTSSPGANLEVRGSSSNGQIRVGGSTSGTYSQIYSDNDGVFILNADQGNNAANSYLGFNVDNSERLRIDSSGNVGIGNSSPSNYSSTGRNLVVGTGSSAAGLTVASGATNTGNIYFAAGSTGDDQVRGQIRYNHSIENLDFYTDASLRLRIDGSGDVQARRARSNTAGDVALSVQPSDSTIHYGLRIDSTNNSLNLDRASGTAANLLTVDSSGNVGIGATSPGRLLHLKAASSTAYSGGSDTAGYNFLKLENTTNDKSVGMFFQIGSNGEAAITATEVSDGATDIAFQNRGGGVRSEKMRIDSSGRVGIGTSSPANPLHIADEYPTIRLQSDTGSYQGRNTVGAFQNLLSIECDNDNAISSSAITFGVDGSERLRIDSLGRLFVGTTSQLISGAEKKLQMTHAGAGAEIVLGRDDSSVASGNSLGAVKFVGNDGGTYHRCAQIEAIADGSHSNTGKATNLKFSVTRGSATTPSERLRIESEGRSMFFAEEAVIYAQSAAGAGTTHALITGAHSNGTVSLRVWTNGNIQNTNNSYGSLSDSKLKENIVDANSQWDDIKDIRVRNYNFIEGETHTQLGVVAQEVETVSPGLVYETPDVDDDGNDLGTVTKSVNYSVLYMKAVKALQEAQTRIEALETQNTAQQTQINDLLSRVTALETAS